jgi:hypothetical protein
LLLPQANGLVVRVLDAEGDFLYGKAFKQAEAAGQTDVQVETGWRAVRL